MTALVALANWKLSSVCTSLTTRTWSIHTASLALCLALSTPSDAHVSAASKSSRYSNLSPGSFARLGVGSMAFVSTAKSALPCLRSSSPPRISASASCAAFLNLAGLPMCAAIFVSADAWSTSLGGSVASDAFVRLASGSMAGSDAGAGVGAGLFADGRSSNSPMVRVPM